MGFGVALFGAGRIGRIHAANIAAHRDLTLTSVSDVNADFAREIADRHGARVATIDDAINDPAVDGVLVATSTDTHLELTLRAHHAGKVVFCEKPVDLDLARARAAAVELGDTPVFVGFNRRFDPNFAVLKAKLAAGEVGALETLQITSNDPAPPPVDYVRVSGGLFADMTIHDFDMARFLLDEDPVEVFAWGSCLVDPAIGEAGDIDTARIMLRTASGKLAVIANSRRSGFGYDQRIEAYGSDGLVKANNMTASTVEVWQQGGARSGPFQNFFLERYAAAFRHEIDHFADILAGRAKPLATFADGVAALALADAARRSLMTGAAVTMAAANP